MTLLSIVQTINAYLSDYILVILLIAVGLWYSVKTKFVQIRYFGEGMRRVFGNLSLKGEKHTHSMTSFQALATAIAAQVGTGNIVGASGAILNVEVPQIDHGDLCTGFFTGHQCLLQQDFAIAVFPSSGNSHYFCHRKNIPSDLLSLLVTEP